MSARSRAAGSLAAALLILLASSCARAGPKSTGEAVTPASPTGNVVAGSRLKVYSSLRELAGDSDCVVSGVPTERAVDSSGPIPVTISTFRVDRYWRGNCPAAPRVRQMGAPGDVIDEGVLILEIGVRYVLFLAAFELEPGKPSKTEFGLTGAAGAYRDDGGVLTRLDPTSASLPTGISADQFARLIQA